MASEIDMDLGNNLEPLTRSRSNTWPMPIPQPTNYKHESLIDGMTMTGSTESIKIDVPPQENYFAEAPELLSIKKKPSRRNAWGNLSYAELITLAINGAKEKRLTLSQIYAWMVKNVSFFESDGDTNSSVGWKNSIRHNLSLHNRFIRVPNENAGKSSWWMINPHAVSGKANRRRAASMEVGKFERKRNRAKKNLETVGKENLKSNLLYGHSSKNRKKIDLTLINSAPIIESTAFPLRATNFISLGRRLSPISSNYEIKWPIQHDISGTPEQIPTNSFLENLESNPSSHSGMNSKKIDLTFINNVPIIENVESTAFSVVQAPNVISLRGKLSPIPSSYNKAELPIENYIPGTPEPLRTNEYTVSHPLTINELQQYQPQNPHIDLSSMSEIHNYRSRFLNQVQIIPCNHGMIQQKAPCIFHQQVYCSCNINIVEINSAIPINQTEHYALHKIQEIDQVFCNKFKNEENNVNIFQSTFLHQSNYIDSGSVQLDNGVQNITPLIRNNSLLDDIDEIIRKEQADSINIVNDCMSSSLYINKNENQPSYIH